MTIQERISDIINSNYLLYKGDKNKIIEYSSLEISDMIKYMINEKNKLNTNIYTGKDDMNVR